MSGAATLPPEAVDLKWVSGNYFTTLGVRSAAGRVFDSNDSEHEGESPLVVLSHRFWTRRFQADRQAVAYTHLVRQRDTDELALQYWFFFYFNDLIISICVVDRNYIAPLVHYCFVLIYEWSIKPR